TIEEDLPVRQIFVEDGDKSRGLKYLRPSTDDERTRTLRKTLKRCGIVLPKIFHALLVEGIRPCRYLVRLQVRHDIAVVGARIDPPDSREVRLAVGHAWRRTREIRRPIGIPRDSWGWLLQPLGPERRGDERHDQDQSEPIHAASLTVAT